MQVKSYAGWMEQNFFYTTGLSANMAAAGAVANMQILIGADAPFKCYQMTAHVVQANVLVANWAGTIVWREQVSGSDLMNAAIPFDAIAGNGQNPYILTPPRIFAISTTLVFTATSNVATGTQVYITLHGAKLYNPAVLGA